MAEIKHHNEFDVEETLGKSETFLIQNKKMILTALTVVVLVIAGYMLYKNFYSVPREEKAQVALFKGQEYFEKDAYEVALNGDSIGYDGFLKVADQYSGTDAANLANAYAGICLKNLGKKEEAVKYLEKFNGSDIMVAPAVLAATANCYAELGKLDKASSLFITAANNSDSNSLSPIFLKQAGELLVQSKKYNQALEVYQTIKDKYFNSYQAMDIDKYIEKAKLMK